MSVTTDQPALQVYTCNGIANNGDGKNVTIPRKKAHGGPKKYYGKHSCAVIEQVRLLQRLDVCFLTPRYRRVGLVELIIQSLIKTRFMVRIEIILGLLCTHSADKHFVPNEMTNIQK